MTEDVTAKGVTQERTPYEERFTKVLHRAQAWERNQKEAVIVDDQGDHHAWRDGTGYLYGTEDENGEPLRLQASTRTGGLIKPSFRGGLEIIRIPDSEGAADQTTTSSAEGLSETDGFAAIEFNDGYRGPVITWEGKDGVREVVSNGFSGSPDTESTQQTLGRVEEGLDLLERARLEGFYQSVPGKVEWVRQVIEPATTVFVPVSQVPPTPPSQ